MDQSHDVATLVCSAEEKGPIVGVRPPRGGIRTRHNGATRSHTSAKGPTRKTRPAKARRAAVPTRFEIYPQRTQSVWIGLKTA